MGCTLAVSFAKILVAFNRKVSPDIVLTEPPGTALPNQVKLAASLAKRDIGLKLGPAIVVFDATRIKEQLYSEDHGKLTLSQLKEADIVCITKVDLVSSDEVKALISLCGNYTKTDKIIIADYNDASFIQILSLYIVENKEWGLV